MKYLFVLSFASLLAQGEVTPNLAQMAASAQEAKEKNVSGIFVIDPVTRAKGYKEAFEYLKKMQPSAKPVIYLNDHSTLTNISSIDLTEGGSLLIIKIGTTQGLKYKVVKVEDIASITQ